MPYWANREYIEKQFENSLHINGQTKNGQKLVEMSKTFITKTVLTLT